MFIAGTPTRWSVVLFAVLALPIESRVVSQELDLQWQASGAQKRLAGYIPQRISLTNSRPNAVKKIPADLSGPLFGEITLGPKEQQNRYWLAVDEQEGRPHRLLFDANQNGDLTDDPAPKWAAFPARSQTGLPLVHHIGELDLKIPYSTGALDARLHVYRFDKKDPLRSALKDQLFYYRDFGYFGSAKFGAKSYPAMLIDEYSSGDFRGRTEENSGVRLMLDRNGDGQIHPQSESFDIRKPFKVDGQTWEVAEMAANGRFRLLASSKNADEIPVPMNLVKGSKAIPFKARTTDGREIEFPSSYKGKLVLLDFWATWCGPCIVEVPNVVSNYIRFKPLGFEVLGISLDNSDAAAALAKFTKEKNMEWPQIFDGKVWQSQLAQLYGVDGIPYMLLIDGDSGEVAAGREIRGPAMASIIEAALKKKGTDGK